MDATADYYLARSFDLVVDLDVKPELLSLDKLIFITNGTHESCRALMNLLHVVDESR